MKTILVILGPTATGKTDLAIKLAKKFNGEIVSCDSRQVYKGLDIGTGKNPSGISNVKLLISKNKGYWEIDGIKIWMYDVVDPNIQYSVADYVKDSNRVIEEIRNRGKLPIVVGGTGLYLRALIDGLSNLSIPVDKKLRQELKKLSLIQLQAKLKKISLKKWESLNYSDQQNPRRLIRAIEIVIPSETKNINNINTTAAGLMSTIRIGLTAAQEVLYQRVDERVVSRIKQGMIEEADRLYKNGLSLERIRQLGLEYGVLADYLEGNIEDKEQLIKVLQGKIHEFVRRQLTWFKKEKNVNWFDISDKQSISKIEKQVGKWYDNTDAKQG